MALLEKTFLSSFALAKRKLRLSPSDLAVGLGTLALLYLAARVGSKSLVAFHPPDIIPAVSLDPRNLPNYAARSTLRMFVALVFSTLFTLRLRLCGGAQPARRAGPGAAARHSAIGTGAGLSVDHGDGLHRAVPRQSAGTRSRVHLRHLHRAGLEHDVLVLPLAAHGAERTGRDGDALPPLAWERFTRLELPAVGDRPGLERHDEFRRRLVLSGGQRSDQRAEPPLHAAGPGFLCGRGGIGARTSGAGLGDRHDDRC